jgi:hypothetical protein
MKTVLSAFALRVTLLFAAFALVSAATASARTFARRAPPVLLPPFIVAEDRLPAPALHSVDSATLPEGTVALLPTRNSDGSITLPDGTLVLPPVHNADGTITFLAGAGVDPAPHAIPPGEPTSNGS